VADDTSDPVEPERWDGAEAGPSVERRTPLTQQLGRVVVLVLLVGFAVFAVANSHPVDFSWILGRTSEVPLIVLLLVAFAIGALVGGFVTRQVGRASRRRHQE